VVLGCFWGVFGFIISFFEFVLLKHYFSVFSGFFRLLFGFPGI